MQLAINTRGAYIRRDIECFEIKIEDKKHKIAAKKVQSILITTSVLISSDALLLAHEQNIDVIFLDHFGNPFSRVWHSKFGSTTFIRRKQLEISENQKGVALVKKWIIQKVKNQISHLEKLKKTRKKKSKEIQTYIDRIINVKLKIVELEAENIENIRSMIMVHEGMASKIYFEAISFLLPERYTFRGRSRNPAKDEFNAFLNYGYGVLYSRVERACILAGLDPYIGLLHTDNYGKKSFVFDLIELFRIYVDEIIVKLFSKRMVNKSMFQYVKNGVTLDKEGKVLLIEEFNKEMENTMRYRGRNIKKKNIMEFECHKIANNLIGRKKDVNLADI